jgi:Phosphotransferase enzyme family
VRPEHTVLRLDRVLSIASSQLGTPPETLVVEDVAELTPGLSGARVFRVQVRLAGETRRDWSLILKVTDSRIQTGIAPRDPGVATREEHFYQSGLLRQTPAALRPPSLFGIEREGPRAWLWLEDLDEVIGSIGTPEQAVEAARRNAWLHTVYLDGQHALEDLPWLEREGYSAHAHNVPQAHRHLDALGAGSQWGRLFAVEELAMLHQALDRAEWAADEMRQLPPTLVHGDFHVGNLGFDAAGMLVAIDWAHVGLAPLGCDVATLSSLLAGAPGADGLAAGSVSEQVLVSAYCDELVRRCGRAALAPAGDLEVTVRRACGLWHLTWGLHLRLGPGLDWLLRRPDQDSAGAAHLAADVRDGSRRAVAFLTSG